MPFTDERNTCSKMHKELVAKRMRNKLYITQCKLIIFSLYQFSFIQIFSHHPAYFDSL